MTQYKDDIDVVPHNFNNTTLTLGGEHTAEGLEMVQAERTEDEVSLFTVNSGMAIFVENPKKIGEFTVQILEASPTTKWLWDKRRARKAFKIDMADTAAPNLDVSGRFCRIMKPPAIVRDAEAQTVEWKFLVAYLEMEGDSYRLEKAEDA
jgi:hypothetical protein